MYPGLPSGLLSLAVIGVALVVSPSSAAAQWKQAKSGDGVTVYTRVVGDSSLKEFKAVTQVKARLAAVVALIDDLDNYRSWFADCKEARTLKRVSPTESYTYFVNRAPFPVSDRDMVLHIQMTQDLATRVINVKLTGEPGYFPTQSGRVRVPKLHGSWRLSPGADGTVLVQYQVHSEPGGSVPDFMANNAVADGPFKTMKNLRKAVQLEKYRTAHPSFIKE